MKLKEIVEQNEEELKAVLEAAFCNAVDHVNMEYYVDDFDHWEVEPSETFGCKSIPENYDVSIFEALED